MLMVQAFFAVVIDLFWFALGRTSPVKVSEKNAELPSRLPVASLGEPLSPILLGPASDAQVTNVTTTIPPLESKAVEPTVTREDSVTYPLHEPVVMYVRNQSGTPCMRAPRFEFDTVQMIIPYGAAVTVAAYDGRYARVLHGSVMGWVFKDDVTPQKADVWPDLKEWVIYQSDATAVSQIRALIADSFGSVTLQLPLQAGEYILMRLMADNRVITWPDERPRLPGSWQQILKGTKGIHMSIVPKTDTIMEWYSDTDGGRLAYVESVAPDNTIVTTCVGLIVAGQYTRQEWTQTEWRELRPVFIQVD
jgi:hypothetical protein